jgi:hypothetical protein
MSVSMFVTDGYAFTDTIPAVAGLHPALRFTYRPCTGPETRAFQATPEAKADEAAVKLIISHVENQTFTPIDVDAAGKEVVGEPVVLTAETLKKLHANLWHGIVNRILGYQGPSVGAGKN